jgi:YbgC/YbaW family acyl-CoA thioester hydrolase
MPRVKIDLPASFSFQTNFEVRITDLNYGDHVGNDTVLSFLHEARVRFLKNFGYSELDMEGASLIMADSAIIYKSEMHYGDQLQISLKAEEFSRVGFDLIYKLEKNVGDQKIPVAFAKTALVCFDYKLKKVIPLPETAKIKLSS